MESNQQAIQKLAQFAQAIYTVPTKHDCDQCLANLEAYIQIQLEGGHYIKEMPQVAQHLDLCDICSQAYALLYELAWSEAHGTMAQPDQIPAPDLGFLQASSTSKSAKRSQRLQQLLQHLHDRVVLQFTSDLLTLLQPPPNLAVTRLPGDSARYGDPILKMEPALDINLPITLTVYRDTHQDGFCLIEITIEPPGKSWPDLGGRQVILAFGEKRETAVTDDWGLVYFADVPINDLATMQLELLVE